MIIINSCSFNNVNVEKKISVVPYLFLCIIIQVLSLLVEIGFGNLQYKNTKSTFVIYILKKILVISEANDQLARHEILLLKTNNPINMAN